MELYVLRHSDAAPHGTMKDADRPLTDEGIKKMTRVAEAMRKMELSFDAILSSPYVRAKETAGIVGEIMKCRSLIKLTPNLVSDASPSAVVKEINEDLPHKNRVLVVGHNPFLTILVSVLISGRDDTLIKFRKGGLCKLTAETLRFGQCARLEWLMAPSLVIS